MDIFRSFRLVQEVLMVENSEVSTSLANFQRLRLLLRVLLVDYKVSYLIKATFGSSRRVINLFLRILEEILED
jgi:hypothetical protein